jgi:hypothetical protein
VCWNGKQDVFLCDGHRKFDRIILALVFPFLQGVQQSLGCYNVPGTSLSTMFTCEGPNGRAAAYLQPNCTGLLAFLHTDLGGLCGILPSQGSYRITCGGSLSLSGASTISLSFATLIAVGLVAMFNAFRG